MRRALVLGLSLVLLLAALVLAWNHRYEYADAGKHWSLSDMQPLAGDPVHLLRDGERTAVRIDKTAGDPMLTVVLSLPESGEVEALHLNYRIRAIDLVAGDTTWNKGRLAIQWLSAEDQPGGENDPIHDFTGTGVIDVHSRVVAPTHGKATPRILIQNIARSGGFVVEKLEVTVVHQRAIWHWLWPLLGLAAWGWYTALFLTTSKTRPIAAIPMALMSVFVTGGLILPKNADFKPQLFGLVYQLGDAPKITPPAPPATQTPEAPVTTPHTTAAQTSGIAKPIAATPSPPPGRYQFGKMQPKPGVVSWVQMRLSKFKRLLHLLAFMLPTLLIARLVGIRHAIIIGCFFAIGSEASQLFFGDVWDMNDAVDLLVNLIAVGLGIAAAKMKSGWRRSS